MTVDLRRVAVLGFSDFERDALASCLRLAATGPARHRYAVADGASTAEFAIVDAASAAALHDAAQAGLLASTLVIGETAPRHAGARLARPIEPGRVLAALAALAERAAPGAVAGDAPGRCALVVDDSAVARRFLQRRLTALGWRCDEAADSGEALARLRRAPPVTLVFVDVELGPASALDGLALCRLVRRGTPAATAAPAPPTESPAAEGRPATGPSPVSSRGPSSGPACAPARGAAPAPPVVIVSAHGGEDDRVRGALAGCSDYLAKPLDDARLLEVLRRHGHGAGPNGSR